MDSPEGDRKLRERTFHDRFFADTEIRGRQNEYYDPRTRRGLLEIAFSLLPPLKGGVALYLGSGTNAKIARELEARGASRVFSVDIAPEAARFVRASLRRDGDANAERVGIMDAERVAFRDGTFDLIFGRSIIHHLSIERGREELRRLLKTGGRAIFIEPQGMNPLINLYRRLTPAARTPDEHPLTTRDVQRLAQGVGRLEVRHAYFLELAAYFWLKVIPITALHRLTAGFLGALDRRLFAALPFLRRFAWVVIFMIERDSVPPRIPSSAPAR